MTQTRVHVGIGALILVALAGFFVLRSVSASPSSAISRDVAVSCGESQRAVVRHVEAGAGPQVSIECVNIPAAQTSSVLIDERGGVSYAAPSAVAPAPVAVVPAAVAPMMVPAVYAAQPLEPRVVEVRSAPRAADRAPVAARAKQGRSWQKRALIIGGSAGAGAGIGALIGGKKGALIGAAVGGGGATVVDVLRDR